MGRKIRILIPPSKKTLFFGAFFILLTLSLAWLAYSLGKIFPSTAPDFRVLWLASKDLASGSNPYQNPEIFTGVGYPANTLLFYMPFAFLNYKVAQAIFVMLSVAAIIFSVLFSFKIVKEKIPLEYFFLALALAFLSFPTKFTLGMGQNNAIALLILLFSYLFYKKDKLIQAGIFLGLAISLKTIFVFFLLFFFLKKKWKVITYSLLALGIFVIATVSFSNYGWYDYYLTKVIPPLLDLSGREIYYNQGMVGFVSRLAAGAGLRKNIGTLFSILLIVPTSYLAVKRKDKDLGFSLFVVTLLLVDTLSWQHHFVWLIFPFVVLSAYLTKMKKNILWILMGISYLLVSWNFKNPSAYTYFPETLLLSNQFYGALILWGLNGFLLLKTNSTS